VPLVRSGDSLVSPQELVASDFHLAGRDARVAELDQTRDRDTCCEVGSTAHGGPARGRLVEPAASGTGVRGV
jgi:hypothetical protein